MNQNQLIKLMRENEKLYMNFENYSKAVLEAKLFRVSLAHVENLDEMAKNFDDAMGDRVISLPYDNVFFDLRDYPMPHMVNGERVAQNIGLHLKPIVVPLKEYQLVLLLVVDYRIYEDIGLMMRSYLVYSDQSGMRIMPSVTLGTNDCDCYKQNVFSGNPAFTIAVSEHLPCAVSEIGYALPDCGAFRGGCTKTVGQKSDIGALLKNLLGYITIPTNAIFEVSNKKRNKKASNRYHIVIDRGQYDKIKSGDINFETSGNSFVDGKNFVAKLDDSPFTPENFELEEHHYRAVKEQL